MWAQFLFCYYKKKHASFSTFCLSRPSQKCSIFWWTTIENKHTNEKENSSLAVWLNLQAVLVDSSASLGPQQEVKMKPHSSS